MESFRLDDVAFVSLSEPYGKGVLDEDGFADAGWRKRPSGVLGCRMWSFCCFELELLRKSPPNKLAFFLPSGRDCVVVTGCNALA